MLPSEQKYYYRIANKPNHTQNNFKSYWLLLKIFLNNKKIPLITPWFHENRFIIDLKVKARLFNNFFSKQRSLITNHSKRPTSPCYLTYNPAGDYIFKVNNRNTRTRCDICSKLTIKTPERRDWGRPGVFIAKLEQISHLVLVFLLLTLSREMPAGKHFSTVTFSDEDLGKIRSPVSTKAHGHNYSIPMLKLCSDAICKPLEILNQALISVSLRSDWKKANTVPIHKASKQTIVLFVVKSKRSDTVLVIH